MQSALEITESGTVSNNNAALQYYVCARLSNEILYLSSLTDTNGFTHPLRLRQIERMESSHYVSYRNAIRGILHYVSYYAKEDYEYYIEIYNPVSDTLTVSELSNPIAKSIRAYRRNEFRDGLTKKQFVATIPHIPVEFETDASFLAFVKKHDLDDIQDETSVCNYKGIHVMTLDHTTATMLALRNDPIMLVELS